MAIVTTPGCKKIFDFLMRQTDTPQSRELEMCRLTVLPAGRRYPPQWRCPSFAEMLFEAESSADGALLATAAAACRAA
eukprot:2668802-Pyramimonas_sp.AAC.1